jgi:hypothetical protein
MSSRFRIALSCTFVCLLLPMAAASCASGGAQRPGSRVDESITASDLESGGYNSIYAALRQLRPSWLNRLNGVYADGFETEGQSWLRTSPTDGVALIELLSCEEAMVRLPVSGCVSGRYINVRYRR